MVNTIQNDYVMQANEFQNETELKSKSLLRNEIQIRCGRKIICETAIRFISEIQTAARLCVLHFGIPYIIQHTISRRLATTFSRV